MKTYNKLIRDRIPELIERAGKTPHTRVLDEEEMEKALKEKLLEEVNEFIESDQIEEIADILEVIEAIAKLRGVHMALIAGMKEEKKEERGGFEKRLLLERVEDP